MMATEDQAPLDVFVHSNPAICALVLYWASRGFAAEASTLRKGLLFPWGILAVGMVASARYRSALPKTLNARLPLFFVDNPDLRFAIPSMLHAWRDPFWSGLRYGVWKGIISTDGLYLSASKVSLKRRTGIAVELEKTGVRFGRLVGREGSDSRLASMLGAGFVA
jgi:ABC-3C biological conflict system middle component